MAIPCINVELDKPRKFRLTTGAMIEFEQITGVKIADVDKDGSVLAMTKLLWIMLKQDDPELTFERTLELIDDYSDGLGALLGQIEKAANPTGGKPKLAAIKKA